MTFLKDSIHIKRIGKKFNNNLLNFNLFISQKNEFLNDTIIVLYYLPNINDFWKMEGRCSMICGDFNNTIGGNFNNIVIDGSCNIVIDVVNTINKNRYSLKSNIPFKVMTDGNILKIESIPFSGCGCFNFGWGSNKSFDKSSDKSEPSAYKNEWFVDGQILLCGIRINGSSSLRSNTDIFSERIYCEIFGSSSLKLERINKKSINANLHGASSLEINIATFEDVYTVVEGSSSLTFVKTSTDKFTGISSGASSIEGLIVKKSVNADTYGASNIEAHILNGCSISQQKSGTSNIKLYRT
jgi:hypothetical protein